MFEEEIDEIYELCKRVVNEVPTASVAFCYSTYSIRVCGLKRKKIFTFLNTNLNGTYIRTYLLIHFTRKKTVKSLMKLKLSC